MAERWHNFSHSIGMLYDVEYSDSYDVGFLNPNIAIFPNFSSVIILSVSW